MTLESTVCREKFVGNGVTRSFDFTFRVWLAEQVLVYRQTAAAREEDCTSETTVTINDEGVAGGTVTFATAPASGVAIAIVRNMPFIQEDVYINGVKFDAKEVEDRFDQDCAERQQLLLGVNQAVKVPYTDSRSVEEYTEDFWDAVDQTLHCRDEACSCATKSCECADAAEDSANRSESAAILGTLAENIDATWDLDADVSANSRITLPYYYYPARNILHLSYDGVEMYLGAQYSEVGTDPDVMSDQVTTLIDLRAGMQMHMWVVMSNVTRYAEETLERLGEAREDLQGLVDAGAAEADRAGSEADRSATEADRSCECADVSCSCAEKSCECADRAQDAAVLGTLAENLEAVWTLDADVSSGSRITLPIWYYPARRILHLSYDGIEMYPGSQFDEGGTDQDVMVNTVTVYEDLAAGTEMHAWVVMSNVTRYAEALLEKMDEEAARGEDAADRSCECAEKSCACANRSESAAILGTLVENLEAVWTLEEDVPAGSELLLPMHYYPARHILHLSYDGIEMYPGYQFEETGTDPDVMVGTVTVLEDIAAGTEMHMWAVMSNVTRYAEQMLESMKETLEEGEECRDKSCACAERSCECAADAEKSKEQSANSAAEATEQADRADDAALDAANAAEAARRAAACAYMYRRGRRLGAVLEFDVLDNAPSGFWVVNPEIVVPATIQHPLTPVPFPDATPDYCDGFFVVAPAFDDPSPCPEPPRRHHGRRRPGRPELMPCGRRKRYSTE